MELGRTPVKTSTKTSKSTRRPLAALSTTIHEDKPHPSPSPLKPSDTERDDVQSTQDRAVENRSTSSAAKSISNPSDDENVPPPPPPPSHTSQPLARKPMSELSMANTHQAISPKDNTSTHMHNLPAVGTPERQDRSAIDIYSDASSSPFDPLTPGVVSNYGQKSNFDFGFIPAPEQLDDSGGSDAEQASVHDARSDRVEGEDDGDDDSGSDTPRRISIQTPIPTSPAVESRRHDSGNDEETDENDTPKASKINQQIEIGSDDGQPPSPSPAKRSEPVVNQPAGTPSPETQSRKPPSSPMVPATENVSIPLSPDVSSKEVDKGVEAQSQDNHIDEAPFSPPSPPQPQSNQRTSKSTTQLLHERISMLGQSRPSHVSRITKSITATVGHPTPSHRLPSASFAEAPAERKTNEVEYDEVDHDGRPETPAAEDRQSSNNRENHDSTEDYENGLAVAVGPVKNVERDAEDPRTEGKSEIPIEGATTAVNEQENVVVPKEQDQLSSEALESRQTGAITSKSPQRQTEQDQPPPDDPPKRNTLDNKQRSEVIDAGELKTHDLSESESSPAKTHPVESQASTASSIPPSPKASPEAQPVVHEMKEESKPLTPAKSTERFNHRPINPSTATRSFKRPMSRPGSALKPQPFRSQQPRREAGISKKPTTTTATKTSSSSSSSSNHPGRATAQAPAPEHRRLARAPREAQKKPRPAPVSIRVGTLSSRRIPLSNNDNIAGTDTGAGASEVTNDYKRTPQPVSRARPAVQTPASAASMRSAVARKATMNTARASGVKGTTTSSVAGKAKPPLPSKPSFGGGVHKNRKGGVGSTSTTASAQKRRSISAQQRFLQQQHQQEERRQRQQQQEQEQHEKEVARDRNSAKNDVQRPEEIATTTTTATAAADAEAAADNPQNAKKIQALQAIERRRMENAAKKLEMQQKQRPQQPLRPHLQRSALFNPSPSPSPSVPLSSASSQPYKSPHFSGGGGVASYPLYPTGAAAPAALTASRLGGKRPLEDSLKASQQVTGAKKPSVIHQSETKRRKTGDEDQEGFERTQSTAAAGAAAQHTARKVCRKLQCYEELSEHANIFRELLKQQGLRSGYPQQQQPMSTIRAVNATNITSGVSVSTKENNPFGTAGPRAFTNQNHTSAATRPLAGGNVNSVGDSQPRSPPSKSTKATSKTSKSPSITYPNGETIQLPEIATDESDSDASDDDDDNDNSNASGHSPARKMVPDWAKPQNLHRLLLQQDGNDGEDVFGPAPSPHIEEIFKDSKHRHGFRDRTSSANWNGPDGLTQEEIDWDNSARERLKRNGGWVFGAQ